MMSGEVSPSSARTSIDDASASTSSLAPITTSNGNSNSNSNSNGKDVHAVSTSTSDGGDKDEDEAWRDIATMSESEVRTELTRVREQRDTFETQYRSLLSKLTTMRATLGDRLRQDAEELDRRETQIETLVSKVESLESTASTLRTELVSSHAETDRLTNEVDKLRTSLAAKQQAEHGESSRRSGGQERERELHELVERVKLDAHAWEAACLEERARREDLEAKLAEATDQVERAKAAEAHYRGVAEREAASAAELSTVLSEFQSTQESELQRALGDHRTQLDTLSASLASYRARAEEAESRLQENADLASQAEKLSAQVKEKNLLIGKLRHEAVILNEHLTEALRRLRNDQSDTNVDKRLVTNLLIQFITTPRADGKRYEMLNLIAGVLGWKEEERELAGLQRSSSSTGTRPSLGSRASTTGAARIVSTSSMGTTAGVGADESFSNLFVEFLLSEAERGKTSKEQERPDVTESSAPNTPGLPTRLFSPIKPHFGSDSSSPSKSDATPATTVDSQDTPSRGGGGLGSYFGLSRASNK